MTKEEIIDILINDAGYEREEVLDMTHFELFDAWCIWEGLINYSELLWETVINLYDDDITAALHGES